MQRNKGLSGGLSIALLGVVLAVSPLRQVFAYAPSQWRPVQATQAGSFVHAVVDKRFRPVSVVVPHRGQVARALPAVQSQAPVFARQYDWRPAPSSWQPKQPSTQRVAQQYRPWPAQANSVVMQGDSRWRPLNIPSTINPASARVAVSMPVPAPVVNPRWRSTVQQSTARHQAQAVIGTQVPTVVQSAASPVYWPQQHTAQFMQTYPQQLAWGNMPMLWSQMPQANSMMAYMAQPMQAFMYPRTAYSAQNTYMPLPPMPYYGQPSAMLRPRWVNGQLVWSQLQNYHDPHQPSFPTRPRALANVRPERICLGCGS